MRSTGDWDFSDTNWQLDTAQYISAPTSWRKKDSPNGTTRGLIKTSVVPIASVKEGRIITYIKQTYIQGRTLWIFYFRYQDSSNYYFVKIEPTGGYLYCSIGKRVAGVDTTLQIAATSQPDSSWRRIRVTWWNDYVGLVIRFEWWNGSAWVNLLSDAYDSNNLWSTIGGRIGFLSQTLGAGMHSGWIDDTEIYGIA